MKPEIRQLALDMGVSLEAIKKWRQRGGVAHAWRIPMLHRAVAQGVALSVEDMDWQPTSAKEAA